MGQTEGRPVFKNERLLLRFAIGLLLLAGLVFGINWLRSFGRDPDKILTADTKGMMAALQFEGDGTRVVLFDTEGKKIEVKGWSQGNHDQKPTWRPDGQRLFFSSDREDETFHIFRFRPGGDAPERRSVGSRSKGTPWFGPAGYAEINESAILVAGGSEVGSVCEYSAVDGSIRQILPPTGDTSTGEEGGTVNQASAIYSRIGESFKEAKWGKDRRFVIATMKREDGEILLIQDFEPDAQGKMQPPVPIAAGNSITFDVGPDGAATICVLDFQWIDSENIPEEFIKDGKAVRPFAHGVIYVDPSKPGSSQVIFATKENESVLAFPAVSPDGTQVLYSNGKLGPSGEFEPLQLIVAKPGGVATEGAAITPHGVFEATWTPDSKSILYARPLGGVRPIFQVDPRDGTEKRLTHDDGEYAFPTLSPQ
ncbi:MAG: PD40 domain-containing protein [Chthonomonas sp.]|nr:PD40 domain-containing protein [Chthonomonas sp.]